MSMNLFPSASWDSSQHTYLMYLQAHDQHSPSHMNADQHSPTHMNADHCFNSILILHLFQSKSALVFKIQKLHAGSTNQQILKLLSKNEISWMRINWNSPITAL